MTRRRRTYFDPLAASKEARWLEVRTMWGGLLESHTLPAGDITRQFIESILNHLDQGWTIPEFSSRVGMYRAVRGSETRLINVVLNEPGKEPEYRGGAHMCESPTGRKD